MLQFIMKHQTNFHHQQIKNLNTPIYIQKLSDQSENGSKKKRKLFLRRNENTVPMLLNSSYIFKVNQSIIINERALKQPQDCNESFMATLFYFKSIQSLNINKSYVSLGLKEIQKQQFPISYYIERFKSFGDCDFNQLAKTLELLNLKSQTPIKKISAQISQEQQKTTMRKQLQEVLMENQGKRILIFYNQPTGTHVTMNRVILSTQLLTDLGYKIEDISKQFLRYRHVFFQIFDTTFYQQIVNNLVERLSKKNANNKNQTDYQTFINHIYRAKQDDKGIYEQKVKAMIKFTKPYPHILIYQIFQIDQDKIIDRLLRKSLKNSPIVKEWEEKNRDEQINNLRSLQYNDFQNLFKQ